MSVPSTLATRRWRVPGKESLAIFLMLAWLPKTRPLSSCALKDDYPWDSTEVFWFFGCIPVLIFDRSRKRVEREDVSNEWQCVDLCPRGQLASENGVLQPHT